MKPGTRSALLELSRRIREEILSAYTAGASLPSERALSRQLGETQNRIHRALEMLVENGDICSSGCRRGYYLCSEKLRQPGVFSLKQRIELIFFLPLEADSPQVQHWQRLCRQFCMLFPQIDMKLLFGSSDKQPEADIHLCWLPLQNTSLYLPLNPPRLRNFGFSRSDFLDSILKTGQLDGVQYAMPILQMPGVFWTHRNLSRRCGLFPEDFTEPLDFFRWGTKIEEAGLCAMGFYFYGFTYHAMNWGVTYRHRQHQLVFSRNCLKKFLTDIKPWISPSQIPYTPFNYYNLFHRGQLGMYAGYLSALPLKEHRFQLLGQPLGQDGYACHTAFLLALGRNCRQTDYALEFIRFILSPHIQQQFFAQNSIFSVLRDVYAEEYKNLDRQCAGSIPPYDFRGFAPQIDRAYNAAGRYLYEECAKYLCDYTSLDQAMERIACFDAPEDTELRLSSQGQNRP